MCFCCSFLSSLLHPSHFPCRRSFSLLPSCFSPFPNLPSPLSHPLFTGILSVTILLFTSRTSFIVFLLSLSVASMAPKASFKPKPLYFARKDWVSTITLMDLQVVCSKYSFPTLVVVEVPREATCGGPRQDGIPCRALPSNVREWSAPPILPSGP